MCPGARGRSFCGWRRRGTRCKFVSHAILRRKRGGNKNDRRVSDSPKLLVRRNGSSVAGWRPDSVPELGDGTLYPGANVMVEWDAIEHLLELEVGASADAEDLWADLEGALG